MVDRDPLFPWLMALTASRHTSGPITSPTSNSVRVVSAGAAHQVPDGQAAVAVRVGQHLLQFHHVRVQLRVPPQPQLQGPFHGDQPLRGPAQR